MSFFMKKQENKKTSIHAASLERHFPGEPEVVVFFVLFCELIFFIY